MVLKLSLFCDPDVIEVGCDEVGAGCLAGMVCAGAVVWDPTIDSGLVEQIKDSKVLSASKRGILNEYIKENAIDYAIGIATVETIDSFNIKNARFLAMHLALDEIKKTNFNHILVDGNMFHTYQNIPHTCLIGGDNSYVSIAAASIIAKVYRDDYMSDLAKSYPVYDWQNNKGYGTKKHIDAIKQFGITEHHRKTFEPVKSIFAAHLRKFID